MRGRLTKNRAFIIIMQLYLFQIHVRPALWRCLSSCSSFFFFAYAALFRSLSFWSWSSGFLLSWNQNKNWMRLCLNGVSLRIGQLGLRCFEDGAVLVCENGCFSWASFSFPGQDFNANLDIRVFKFSVDAFATFTASFSSSSRRFFSFTAEAFFARLDMTAVRKWQTKRLERCVLEAS